MSKITWRLATAAATLAVTGGIIFTTSGAASAATGPSTSVTTAFETASYSGYLQRWDGRRWWFRYSAHGDWYSTGHGERYRFDGHRFYRWDDGKWKRVSAAYARHHSLDRGDLYGRARVHHGEHHNRGHKSHARHGHKSHGNHDDNHHNDHHDDHRHGGGHSGRDHH